MKTEESGQERGNARSRHRPDETHGGTVRTRHCHAFAHTYADCSWRVGGGHGAVGPDVRAARQGLPGLRGGAAGEHVRDLSLRDAAGGTPRSWRHRRGACGWPAGPGLRTRVAGDPRREPGPGQRRSHPDRTAGGVHDRDQEPSGPDTRVATARRNAGPGAGAAQDDRGRDGDGGRGADRVQSRVGGQADGAQEGRAGRPGADAAALPGEAPGEALTRGDRALARLGGAGASRSPRKHAGCRAVAGTEPASPASRSHAGAAGASVCAQVWRSHRSAHVRSLRRARAVAPVWL